MRRPRTALPVALLAASVTLTACSLGNSGTGQSVTNERLDPDAVEPLPSETVDPPPAQDVDALQIAAQEYAERFGTGEYDLAWETWSEAARGRVDRATYVAYAEECELGGDRLVAEVSDARIVAPGEGTVRAPLEGAEQTYTLLYEDDDWRWVPPDATLEALADASPTDLPACP